MKQRPNILLVHCDQHRYDCIGAHGHPLIETPTLDRLAREGTDFSRAFTPCPVCSPARASLMTGAWPTTHGCLCIPNTEIYRPARRELPVLTRLLKDAGYGTGYVGKYHEELEGDPTDHGVDRFVRDHAYRPWREAQGLPPVPRTRGFFGEIDEACPTEAAPLAWQADRVIEMVEEAANRETPFFLRWDPPEPHLPCKPPRAFAERYPPERIEPWSSWPDPLENKPDAQRRQWRIWGVKDWPWDKWQPVVSRYLAVITELDHHLGRVLAALESRELLDETLVVYTSDHGDFCGGHGLIDKHFAMYDDILRVPLLVRWPGRVPAGRTCGAFVSHELEIARTLLEVAGIAPPESFAGQDLVELASGRGAPRADIFSQYFGTESGAYSVRAVRDERFKYVYHATGLDECYDLESDPGELHNRIDDPSLAEERRRLRERLGAWMESVRDPLWNGWVRTDLLDAPSQAERAGL